jgi:hypothetical protein
MEWCLVNTTTKKPEVLASGFKFKTAIKLVMVTYAAKLVAA